MNSPLAAIREFRQWRQERAKAISFAPEIPAPYFGPGLGTHQPAHETLLKENIGVADICTRAIANRVGSLNPLVKVSTRTTEGTLEDEILDDHVLKQLLDNPHQNWTKQQLFRLTTQYLVTVGEGYWLKVANELSLPGALQPMPPQYVNPILRDGVIDAYEVLDGDKQILRLEARDVVRFWFPDPETLYTSEGYLGPNGINTDAYRFASEHLRSNFQNDATPKVILHAGKDAVAPDPDQWKRYIEQWRVEHHQRDGTRRGLPARLPPGWEPMIVALMSGADITPLLEHWQAQQLMNFGVPASILGRVVSGDRSSAETNQFVFDKHTILPIAQTISDAITQQLAPDFDDSIFVEFEPFVSDDKEFQLKQEAQDLALKVRSGQQVISDRGGDPELATWAEFPVGTFSDQPYTGEPGDDPFDVTPDDPDAFDMEEPDEPEDDEPRTRAFDVRSEQRRIMLRERKFRPKLTRGLRYVFEAQRKQALKVLREDVPRSARQSFDVSELFDPEGWGPLFDVRALAELEQAYLFAANESLANLGIATSFEFTPAIEASLRANGGDLIAYVNETTRRRLEKKVSAALAEGVAEGKPTKAVAKAINEVFSGRKKNAATIARTELHRASVEAQVETFRIANVPWKQWVDQQDNNVRDAHESSRIASVKRDDPFIVDGTPMMGPGDRSAPPHLTVNCRCGVVPLYRDPTGIEKS